jgi:hypothetical protein
MSDDTTPQDDSAMSPASAGYLAWRKGLLAWRLGPLTNPYELRTADPLRRQFVFTGDSVSDVTEHPEAPKLNDAHEDDPSGDLKCYSVEVSPFGNGEWLVTAWYR